MSSSIISQTGVSTDKTPGLSRLSDQLLLDELWDTLGDCLSELAKTSDHHAVLVLQPAVEAFFLVHAGKTLLQGIDQSILIVLSPRYFYIDIYICGVIFKTKFGVMSDVCISIVSPFLKKKYLLGCSTYYRCNNNLNFKILKLKIKC